MSAAHDLRRPEMPAQHLLQLLLQRGRNGRQFAVTQKRGGQWENLSWADLVERVRAVSDGLVRAGLKPGDRVAIFAATSLNWVVWDLAVNAARGVTVPIYASNTPDECKYILNHSEAAFLFVDDDVSDGKQAGRLSRIRARLEDVAEVRKVFVAEGEPRGEREASVASLVAGLGQVEGDAMEARIEKLNSGDMACLLYTSGTTGDPKGVMLSLANWGYEANAVNQIGLMAAEDAVMLFLPLAHVFAQVVKAAWLGTGFRMIFAESTEKLIANLAETRPTVLPSVPRVFEKVFANVVAQGQSAPGIKGKLFRWAFRLFDEYVDAQLQGRPYGSMEFALARRLVFSKVRASLDEKLGGKMRLFVSGGAPLSPKIAYFFDLLGFQVLEGYGLSETSAATCVNRPGKIKIGTVGPGVPGTELKIAPDGEILVRGGGVMTGYFRNKEATVEALEAHGWFHTGDIGELDAEGYLRITDRKKDIIVTAGGKNVSPQNLENQLKTFPLVSQAMVHGDRRKYLSVLISVSEEQVRKLVTDPGAASQSYAMLVRRPEIVAAVQAVVDRLNADLPPYETLKRFALADHEFSQETGEITPTLKVKRKYVTQKYQADLDALYDETLA